LAQCGRDMLALKKGKACDGGLVGIAASLLLLAEEQLTKERNA
jgi:hypothetical protein